MTVAEQFELPVVYPALLFDLDLPGGGINFWTGIGPLVVGSTTYVQQSGIDAGVSVVESLDLSSLTTGMRLAGLQPEILAIFQNEEYQNSEARIWMAAMNASNQLQARETIFHGLIENAPIRQAASGESEQEIEISHLMTLLSEVYDFRYTKSDQIKYAVEFGTDQGDTIFDFIA